MISFYRKYRPQTASELDLERVREFFGRILKSGQVSHAYLFTGPKGTGKTSAARILAKIVNCERNSARIAQGAKPNAKKEDSEHSALSVKPLQEPCNVCEVCKSITNGSNVDILEIDAASNRGIDDIRDLREKIRLAPVAAFRKVYIVDEVHMLTMEAFNALLKILEEPPEHALFVLATTEAHKVPETIMSRCVRLHFPQASVQEVVRSLDKAVKGEKLKVEKGVLEAIAESAEGSFREAMKLLEQLALSGKKITLEEANRLLGISGEVASEKFLQAFKAKDRDGAIEELNRLEKMGVNWQVFVRQALEELRRELLEKGEGIELIQKLLWAAREMREAPIAQLPLEIVVAEWCSRADARMKPFDFAQGKNEELRIDNEPRKAQAPRGKQVNLEEIQEKWKEVLVAVKPHNHSLEGLLRSTKPVEVVGDKLRIEVFYQFHLDQLKQEKFLKLVEEAVASVFSSGLRLEYYLGNKSKQVAPIENISGDVNDNDIVKAAEEIFGA